MTSHQLSPIKSDLICATHGFFGREGGVSSGVYASLNCGYGSGDARERVAQNRELVAREMAIAENQLAGVYQTHSTDVVIVTPDHDSATQADAMVTAHHDIGLSVLTADCQPVLFCDPMNQIIGATHAGWRGALGGVIEATVAAMVGLGAERTQIHAAIGPCISQRAYEVGQEFIEEFLCEDPGYAEFFANGANGRYHFDLPRFGLQRLRACEIADAQWVGACTYSEPTRFFSFRRNTHDGETDYGRQISVITL